MKPGKDQTATATLEIINKLGLHARAAAKLCELTATFDAKIEISKDSLTVGGTSLMALLMLGAAKGATINVSAAGPDAAAAVEAISALVSARFGEQY